MHRLWLFHAFKVELTSIVEKWINPLDEVDTAASTQLSHLILEDQTTSVAIFP
jgi:hypothetical protein